MPFSSHYFDLMRVRAAGERRQLARQVDLLQRHIRPTGSLESLIGTSAAMAAGQGVDPPRGAGAGDGAHHGRDRHGQGAGGARRSTRAVRERSGHSSR